MNLKEHFEANMLDGDDIEHCGGAMISAKAVLEYTEDLVQQLLESLEEEVEKMRKVDAKDHEAHDWKCNATCHHVTGICLGINTAVDQVKALIQSKKTELL